MSETMRSAALIDRLAGSLAPVRRLPPPGLRLLGWLGVAAGIGLALTPLADLSGLRERLMAVPDMWLAVVGSVLTASCAGYAAFQTSLPDRSPRWALLPILPALLWVGASGMGCLRGWLGAGTTAASMPEMRVCLVFILGLSVPLSAALVAMLRWACPLRPGLTATLAGLASASAAASLLTLFHPYDATATDLAVHAIAVAAVVLANQVLGGRLFGRA